MLLESEVVALEDVLDGGVESGNLVGGQQQRFYLATTLVTDDSIVAKLTFRNSPPTLSRPPVAMVHVEFVIRYMSGEFRISLYGILQLRQEA